MTECEIREAETGPEGLIEHNRNILEARTKLFKDYARLAAATARIQLE